MGRGGVVAWRGEVRRRWGGGVGWVCYCGVMRCGARWSVWCGEHSGMLNHFLFLDMLNLSTPGRARHYYLYHYGV